MGKYKLSIFWSLCSLFFTCTASLASPVGDRPVRIMPLGDSITAGLCDGRSASNNCMVPDTAEPSHDCIDRANTGINPHATGYRPYLKQQLNTMGLWSRFVGSMGATDQPTVFADHMHEGHGGWTISGINSCIATWIRRSDPDIILLHIGGNDALQGVPSEEMVNRLNSLVNNVYNAKPNARLIVAEITPLANPSANNQIIKYNSYIRSNLKSNFPTRNLSITSMNAYSSNFSKMQEQLNLSDLSSGSYCFAKNPTHCAATSGVHPNSGGYQKMARAWASAIQAQMRTAELITANGRYWNYPDQNSALPLSGPLSSISRYNNICKGSASCRLETAAFWGEVDFVEVESTSANSSYQLFNLGNSTEIENAYLSSVPRYKNTVCAGRNWCQFETRTFRTDLIKNSFGDGPEFVDGTTLTEGISAYGNYFEFNPNGDLIFNTSLQNIPKYRPICDQLYPQRCGFDTHTYKSDDGEIIESITSNGMIWNFNHSDQLTSSQSLSTNQKYKNICLNNYLCNIDTRYFWTWSYQ